MKARVPAVAALWFPVLAACGGAAPEAAASPGSAGSAGSASSAASRPPGPTTSATALTSQSASPKEEAQPATASGWPLVEAEPDGRKTRLDRLAKDPGPIKTNWTPPGKSERYGHAEGLVSAAPTDVKKRLLDFTHYKELAGPKFKTVRVVGKEPTGTDVYFQLPIMKGLVTIWYVTRFAPARAAASGDVVEGTFVKGNIAGMHIVLGVQPGPDERTSVMVCDLLLSPGLPAPQSALDEELRDACGDAIQSVRRLTQT